MFAIAIGTCSAFTCELVSQEEMEKSDLIEKFLSSVDLLGKESYGEVRGIKDDEGAELAVKKQTIKFIGTLSLFEQVFELMEKSHKSNEVDPGFRFQQSHSEMYPCLYAYFKF